MLTVSYEFKVLVYVSGSRNWCLTAEVVKANSEGRRAWFAAGASSSKDGIERLTGLAFLAYGSYGLGKKKIHLTFYE